MAHTGGFYGGREGGAEPTAGTSWLGTRLIDSSTISKSNFAEFFPSDHRARRRRKSDSFGHWPL